MQKITNNYTIFNNSIRSFELARKFNLDNVIFTGDILEDYAVFESSVKKVIVSSQVQTVGISVFG